MLKFQKELLVLLDKHSVSITVAEGCVSFVDTTKNRVWSTGVVVCNLDTTKQLIKSITTSGVAPEGATHINIGKTGIPHYYQQSGFSVYFWDKYLDRWSISTVSRAEIKGMRNVW